MGVLTVRGLCKTYPRFKLDNVSFDLAPGKITGFIGRNGAGKSTTLNSLLNYVHPDCGEISFFDLPFAKHENEIKQRLGFVSSGVEYYPKKKLKTISAVTASFYENWDEAAYRSYLDMFALDENKTPSQLSAGMKVKYALTLALSHNADLLILDEPTSGLDPVSRDDLLDVFLELADRGKTILFSTHITSDLDKCADNIIYIKSGHIIADSPMTEFESAYKIAHFADKAALENCGVELVGCKRMKDGYTALIRAQDAARINVPLEDADLESIMVHIEKGED